MSEVRYKSHFNIEETCMLVALTIAKARSKDPHTKVGAVVYDPVTGGMFVGYNGFPASFPDSKSYWDGDLKYQYVIHAEANAIKKAAMALGDKISRCTLFVTHMPCPACIRDWVSSFGIKRVVYLEHKKYKNHDVIGKLAHHQLVYLEKMTLSAEIQFKKGDK